MERAYVGKRAAMTIIDEHAEEAMAYRTPVEENKSEDTKLNSGDQTIIDENITESTPLGISKLIHGYVMEGISLNIRETAATNGHILGVLQPLSPIVINRSLSTESFCHVCTNAGVTGFCKREYLIYPVDPEKE